VYNSDAKASDKQRTEFRTFEKFLIEFEPVVGMVNFNPYNEVKRTRKYCLNKPDLSIIPMIHFDANFNAFHRDALRHLLPYTEDYDKECWCYSQRFVYLTIEFKFRGQAVMYPGITVKNTQHRPYPRHNKIHSQIMQAWIDKERAKLPQLYRNHFAIISYKKKPKKIWGWLWSNYLYGCSSTPTDTTLPTL